MNSQIQVASGSKGFFRHQQKDEPDLTRQVEDNLQNTLISSEGIQAA